MQNGPDQHTPGHEFREREQENACPGQQMQIHEPIPASHQPLRQAHRLVLFQQYIPFVLTEQRSLFAFCVFECIGAECLIIFCFNSQHTVVHPQTRSNTICKQLLFLADKKCKHPCAMRPKLLFSPECESSEHRYCDIGEFTK